MWKQNKVENGSARPSENVVRNRSWRECRPNCRNTIHWAKVINLCPNPFEDLIRLSLSVTVYIIFLQISFESDWRRLAWSFQVGGIGISYLILTALQVICFLFVFQNPLYNYIVPTKKEHCGNSSCLLSSVTASGLSLHFQDFDHKISHFIPLCTVPVSTELQYVRRFPISGIPFQGMISYIP